MKKYLYCILAALAGALSFSSLPLGGIMSFPALFLSAAFPISTGLLFGLIPCVIGLFLANIILFFAYPDLALVYSIIDVIPVIMIIGLIEFYNKNKKSKPLGKTVSWLCLFIAAICFSLFQILAKKFINDGIEGGVFHNISVILTDVFVVNNIYNPSSEKIIKHITEFFPYMLGLSWLTHILLCSSIGESIARKISPKIEKPDYINFSIPTWSLFLIVIFTVISFIFDNDIRLLGINITLILTTPLTLQGLAFCHKKIEPIKHCKKILFLLYLILLVIGIFAVLVLCILGLVEYFSNSDKQDISHTKRQEN